MVKSSFAESHILRNFNKNTSIIRKRKYTLWGIINFLFWIFDFMTRVHLYVHLLLLCSKQADNLMFPNVCF